jgi:hypothetical protein
VETHNSREQRELLQEHVTDAELRELLERLGKAEMGGPEEATVGAIVEATGASPVEVGRILSQVRQEQYEQRFAETFDDHEERIEKLESVPVTRTRTYREEFDPEHREILKEYAERTALEKRTRPYMLLIMIALALIVLAVVNSPRGEQDSNVVPPGAAGFGQEDPTTGKRVERGMDGTYSVHTRDGAVRPATADEVRELDTAEALLNSQRR